MTHCRNCLCERKAVCCQSSHLGLDVMLSAGLLSCPSASLFGREHQHSSLWPPMCRATGMCIHPRWTLRAGNEEEARAFLLPFPDGSLCLCCELPYRRRPHWSRLDALCKGDVSTGPCFNFPMPRAGIPGSWAYLTWLSITWHQLPSYTFPLFPLRPTAWCMQMCELCCSHSHLSYVLKGSWEHKIRLLWSS